MHADIRKAKLEQVQISRTAPQSADQSTTDSYAPIPESQLDATRHNRVLYVLTETGTDPIDAKIQGRIKDDDGNFSSWEDATGTDAAKTNVSDATVVMQPDEVLYDQYRLAVASNGAGTPGDVDQKGRSFHLDT
ncbi:MAG: hypothetical protein U5L04_02600 [Trueperaceae bacterium]|nr:hypothetical protein [Trueperaceae bacterium]